MLFATEINEPDWINVFAGIVAIIYLSRNNTKMRIVQILNTEEADLQVSTQTIVQK